MRRMVLLAAACCGAFAAGPKPKPADYPVHAQAGELALGAEYIVHSFGDGQQMFVTEDHLVVEVAVYPARGHAVVVSSGDFRLRLNGRKHALAAQSPAMVASSLKYPDWELRTVERFPGDPTARRRLPRPPQAPAPDNPAGVEKEEPARADEVAVRTALPEGETRSAVAGYLYFPYKGKLKSILSIELVYGDVTLRLR